MKGANGFGSSTWHVVLSAYGSKAIAVIVRALMIPILLASLTQKEFAALALLSGIEGWIFLLDGGMSYSIQTEMAKQSIPEGALLKTALLYTIIVVCLGYISIFYAGEWFVAFFFSNLSLDSEIALWYAVLFCSLGTLGGVAGKVLIARKRGHEWYYMQIVAHLLSLFFVWWYAQRLSLTQAVVCSMGIPHVFSFFMILRAFSTVDMRAPWQWDLIKKGGRFWGFTCMAACVATTDVWIMARTLSADAIASYHVLCKIFGVASFCYAAFLPGLMSECGALFAKGQGALVLCIIRRYCKGLMIFVGGFTICVLLFSFPIGNALSIPISMMGCIFFAVYLCVRIWADFHAMALQSHQVIRPFWVWVPMQAMISLVLQYFLSRQLGFIGIILGITFSYLGTVCWALPRYMQRYCLS